MAEVRCSLSMREVRIWFPALESERNPEFSVVIVLVLLPFQNNYSLLQGTILVEKKTEIARTNYLSLNPPPTLNSLPEYDIFPSLLSAHFSKNVFPCIHAFYMHTFICV